MEVPRQQDRLHPAISSHPRRPGNRAQKPPSHAFCRACCSSALPPSCSSTKCSRGCGGQGGNWSDVTTLKSIQHCIFTSGSMFNWSVLDSNLAQFLKPTAKPYPAPHSGSCSLWRSQMFGRSSFPLLRGNWLLGRCRANTFSRDRPAPSSTFLLL